MDKEVIGTPEELRGDISEDIFDDSEEVSLLELDQEELAKAMEEAGISIKVPSTVGTHAKHIYFLLLMPMLRTDFTRPYRCERWFDLSKCEAGGVPTPVILPLQPVDNSHLLSLILLFQI